MKKVLVTGGAGYIGSHTCIKLIENGYDILIVDNFSNSSIESIKRLEVIVKKHIKLYEIDCCNYENFEQVFIKEKFDSVIHFAGYKAVGESVKEPVKYYTNNLISSLNLINLMKKYDVKNLVFSSSATVYGDPITVPIYENFDLKVTNPYGRTKLMIEEMLMDIAKSDDSFNITILRYFNPIGAHESGLIGEDPNDIPNNLVPYITQVAVGKLPYLRIFGNDYDTIDGTGVRDYIHVLDLAEAHICALKEINKLNIYNVGTGNGYSVLQVLKSMEKAVGKEIPYKIIERRPGDIATCYANCEKAFKEIGFKAKYNIDDMCFSSWKWQINNPNGYKK